MEIFKNIFYEIAFEISEKQNNFCDACSYLVQDPRWTRDPREYYLEAGIVEWSNRVLANEQSDFSSPERVFPGSSPGEYRGNTIQIQLVKKDRRCKGSWKPFEVVEQSSIPRWWTVPLFAILVPFTLSRISNTPFPQPRGRTSTWTLGSIFIFLLLFFMSSCCRCLMRI